MNKTIMMPLDEQQLAPLDRMLKLEGTQETHKTDSAWFYIKDSDYAELIIATTKLALGVVRRRTTTHHDGTFDTVSVNISNISTNLTAFLFFRQTSITEGQDIPGLWQVHKARYNSILQQLEDEACV